MTTTRALTVGQTDMLADKMLAHCHRAGLVPDPRELPWSAFHLFRERLYATFDVPDTTLTPLAARVLYGLAALHRPKRVAVLGCYVGNLMAWVTGPGFGPTPRYSGLRAVGIDVDADAVAQAQENVGRAGFSPTLDVVVADAFDADRFCGDGPWDLLLVDVDVPVARKSGYARLVQRWADQLTAGALVVAHDVCHQAFRWDLERYHDFVLASGAAVSTTLPVDACGLEVSKWDES